MALAISLKPEQHFFVGDRKFTLVSFGKSTATLENEGRDTIIRVGEPVKPFPDVEIEMVDNASRTTWCRLRIDSPNNRISRGKIIGDSE